MIDNRITESTKDGLLATGGMLGVLGASSCCVLPLAFAAIGISGALIGTLTKAAPFQPVFLAVAALCVGFGLRRAYASTQAACEGPRCGTATSRRMTKLVLWFAAALLVITGSAEWWAQLLA